MKKILAILMTLVLLFSIAAVAEVDPSTLTMAYLTCDRSNEYWVITAEGFEAACAEYGITPIVYDASGDAATQINQAEDALAQNIDVLIMSPVDSAGDTIAMMAKEKGVPVFIADGSNVSEDYVSLIISDNYQGGAMVANYAMEQLGDSIVPVVFDYGGTMEAMVLRQQGFKETIEAAGYTCHVMIADGRDQAASATEDILVSMPEVNCIFAATDNTSLGCCAVLEGEGKVGEIMILGFDATAEGLTEIFAGTLAATVRQDPYMFTWQSVENAIAYLNGEEIPKLINPDLTLVTIDNAADYVK